jgi:hypothetical protein
MGKLIKKNYGENSKWSLLQVADSLEPIKMLGFADGPPTISNYIHFSV